jgi:hypothetical protein
MRGLFTHGPRAVLIALVVVASLAWAGAASASGGDATYSATQTIAVPPATSFAGSGGGDGWAVALSKDDVYQVFHHTTLTVACHKQSDSSPCWTPRQVTQNGATFTTSYKPSLYLDQATGKLYVYAQRPSDGSGGVVCIDTVAAATSANPFCGYTVLVGQGAVPNYLDISAAATVGTRFYAFDSVSGFTAGSGKNQLMCFDVATGAACDGQPYTLDAGNYSTPGYAYMTSAIANRVFVAALVSGASKLLCFDPSTGQVCAGSWPATIANAQATPVPRLDSQGTPNGVCLTGSATCYGFDGSTSTAPGTFASTVPLNGYWFLAGAAVTVGTRIYVPETTANRVDCFDYSTSAGCPSFPKVVSGLSLLYTVNADPQRPSCLWVNADSGTQIQNFDAYTGGACGSGAARVLTSQFVVPQVSCYPTSYASLAVTSPAASSYTSGSVQFADGGGNPIPGIGPVSLDANGVADLSGLDFSTAAGLPQYLITLNGASTQQLTVKLTWKAAYDPACTPPGGDVETTKTAATLSGSLSDGTSSGSSLTVVPGTAITASATLAGDHASVATGSVTYAWYTDANCTTASGTDTEAIATEGTIPSLPSTVIPAGKYSVVVSYSGDAGNEAASTACGALKLDVRNPDDTPPVTTASAPSGWQNGSVTVTLSATDDLSGVADTYYTVDGGPQQSGTSIQIATEGSHTIAFWSVDNAGNEEPANTVTVRIDTTPPTISAATDRAPNAAGWYRAPVTVTFTCSDALSGVASCSSPVTLGEGADQSASGTATDAAGNSASASVSGIDVDLTDPVVAFAGNAGTYSVDQSVDITCSASDALSGVAATTCHDVTGPAWSFAVGANTVTASATDKAGNAGSATASFAVTVDFDSLCTLVGQLSKNAGVANGLCAKLSAAKASAARGQSKTKNNQLDAFDNQVDAQAGKAFTASQATLLKSLAAKL